jgi:hypothetical protein
MGISLSASLARLRGPVSPGSDQPLTTASEVPAVSRFDQKPSAIENVWSENLLKTRPLRMQQEPGPMDRIPFR